MNKREKEIIQDYANSINQKSVSIFADDQYGTEEGDICNRLETDLCDAITGVCSGTIVIDQDACHCSTTIPPCSACTYSYLRCDTCEWEEDE